MTDPSFLVQRFASRLGWNGIVRNDITLTPDICGKLSPGTIVTFWTTTDIKFFIQVNQKTPGQFGEYRVTVIADRYGFAAMDFETCAFESVEGAEAAAQRLAPLFARSNFRDALWRRQYLEKHPEKRLRPKRRGRG